MTEFDTYLRDLVERDQIRTCITKAARGLDRYDADHAKEAFWPDATDDHGTVVGPAFAYIDGRTNTVWKGVQHYLMNQTIDLDGDVAHVETYFMAVIRPLSEDRSEFTVGRYLDRVEKRDDAWRIAHRLTVVEWSGAMNPAPADTVVPGIEMFAKGTLDRRDPSYARPLGPERTAL
jgi:hypothetical protein